MKDLTDDIMYKAAVEKDSSFEGVFYTAVKTTGIFCRPTCTARKPKRENVEFFSSTKEAILHGESVTSTAFDTGYESLSGFGDSFKAVFGASPVKSRSWQVIDMVRLDTPLGPMIACAVEHGICLLEFTDRKMLETELKALAKTLNASIIQGSNPHFVLLAKEQAQSIDKAEAIRAVANANGMNRISILIPCHRVIGADGELTGYGGGIWRKQKLLELVAEN
ncbi:bifunctional transcriptional activator/DNA repair enzyme AdaA [Pedobacter sp. NJ-S-72]